MTPTRALLFVTCAVLSSCSLDTALPIPLQDGVVTGRLELTGTTVAGVPHEVVLLSDNGDKFTAQSTPDDADGGAHGEFRFSSVKPGLYALTVTIAGFEPVMVPFVRVKAAGTVDVGTLKPEPRTQQNQLGRLRWTISNAEGAAVTGAQVECWLPEASLPTATVVTGADGSFSVSLASAAWRLEISHPYYQAKTVLDVSVAEGTDVDRRAEPIVLAIRPATITGVVMKERDGLTPVPAEGAVVSLTGSSSTAVANAAGEFTLSGVVAGVHEVTATLPGFVVETPAGINAEPDGLVALPQPVLLNLRRASVRGTVSTADAARADNITATLAPVGYGAAAAVGAVNSTAQYLINGVPWGDYTLTLAKPGYFNAQVAVRVDGPAITVDPVVLSPQTGDFIIDDQDATNTPGFTRRTEVVLIFTSAANAVEMRVSQTNDLADAGFVPFTNNAPVQLAPGDGDKLVYVQLKDNDGAIGPVLSSHVVLDTQAPPAPLVTLDATGVGPTGVKFTNANVTIPLRVVGNDTGSGIATMRVAADPTTTTGLLGTPSLPYQSDTAYTRTTTLDGTQVVYAQVIDRAGNPSAVGQDTVVVDSTPPAGSLAIEPGTAATAAGFTNQPSVALDMTWAAEPDGGTVSVKLANALGPELEAALYAGARATWAPWFLAAGNDGLRTVSAQFRDTAGNVSAPVSATITLDTTPPTPISASVTPSLSRSATVTVNVASSASDLSPTQAITVSENGSYTSANTVGPAVMPANGQVSFTLTPGDGQRTLYARFKDGAGNVSEATPQVTLDTTPPTGAMLLTGTLADGTTSDTLTSTATITAQVIQQGAAYYVANDAMTSCPAADPVSGWLALPSDGRVAVTLSAAGDRTVKLCLRDAAGNVGAMLTGPMRYVSGAPSGCAFSVQGYRADTGNAPAGRTARPIITVGVTGCTPTEWVVSESALTCTQPGLGWLPYSAGPFSLTGGDGTHVLHACVRNEARATAALTNFNVDLDSTPPSAPSVTLDNGAAYVNLAAYTARGSAYSASALGSATGAVEWSLSETTTFSTWVTLATNNPRTWTFPGTGNRRLYAVFRDDLGNTSPPVSDDITFDVIAPSTTGLSLVLSSNAPVAGFVASSTFGVQVQSAPPADAASAVVAQVATSTVCTTAGVFSASLPRPVETTIPIVAAGGDGAKRLCVEWLDAAGNPSAPLTLNLTVDTTPPAPPEVATPAQLVSAPANTAFTVNLVRPIIETNLLRIEQTGGQLSTWADTGAAATATSFTFNLAANPGAANVINTLALRAIDKAGNVGPSSAVVVTNDTRAPQAPLLTPLSVSNFAGSASLFWPVPSDTDLSYYLVDYGPAPGTYTGTLASEGNSPLQVAASATTTTLHGLINGSPVYARLRAFDRAGNQSSPSDEVMLQPDVMSPTFIAETTFTDTAQVTELELDDDVLITVGTNRNCYVFGSPPNTPTEVVLTAVDLSALKSATQTGALVTTAPPPVVWTLRLPEAQEQQECWAGATDLLLDGPWGFLVTNDHLRILRMGSRTAAPTVVTTLTLPWKGRRLALTGRTLWVAGAGFTSAIDVSSLYDDNASTLPTLAGSTIGTVTSWNEPAGTVSTAGLAVTRGRLLQFGRYAGLDGEYWNAADALDRNSGTTFNDSDLVNQLNSPAPSTYYWLKNMPQVSGNLTFSFNDGQLQTRDLTTLWGGAPLLLPQVTSARVDTSFSTGGPCTVLGAGAWAVQDDSQSPTLYSFDFSRASLGQASLASRFQAASGSDYRYGRSIKAWGPYLMMGTTSDSTGKSGSVKFYEAATPRAMREVASATVGTSHYDVDGPLAYGANGSVLDLQAGLAPVELSDAGEVYSGSNGINITDSVLIGGQVVSTYGGSPILRVTDPKNGDDRNPATSGSFNQYAMNHDYYDVTLPQARMVLAVKAWGEALIVAEERADGVWLEAFSAAAIRDGDPATSLQASDSRGAVRISTSQSYDAGAGNPVLVPNVALRLLHGRAFVSIDAIYSALSPSVFVYDFRNLFDDNAATTGWVAQGTLPETNAMALAVMGTHAYVSTSGATSVWDISPAMDDAPATLLTATAPLGSVSTNYLVQLELFASWLFGVNTQQGASARTVAIDVSNPVAPRVATVSLTSAGSASTSGTVGQVNLPSSLFVAGEYLYVSGSVQTFARTTVIRLE